MVQIFQVENESTYIQILVVQGDQMTSYVILKISFKSSSLTRYRIHMQQLHSTETAAVRLQTRTTRVKTEVRCIKSSALPIYLDHSDS